MKPDPHVRHGNHLDHHGDPRPPYSGLYMGQVGQ